MTTMRSKFMALALATAVTGGGLVTPAAFAQQHWMERLGSRWDTQENGWTGVWSRRTYTTTKSNIFDATWTHPVHATFTSEMRITISVRNEVTVIRTDNTPGNNRCIYKGRINANSTYAWGTHTCGITGSRVHQWSAQIRP